ncbi:MAG: phosphoribosyl-ATP diphosphatase [Candidatus Melainabacteria bacterium]|nr:phosphoribosyl-ATP diphosphatase [Candidatus Melainabacteria bacterium]
MLIPSIDIMDGKAVQLRRGRELVLASERSPVELAREFNRYGEVAVIDLDAAMGRGNNRELVREICRNADVRVGGGLRDEESVRDILKAGARRVIIGTAAEPEFLSRLPAGRVMVALDQIDNKVVDNAWTTATGESVIERARRLSPYCSGFLSTFVESEGSLTGVDAGAVAELRDAIELPLTIAGGVRDTQEAVSLDAMGVDVQVGMALYTGRLDLGEAVLNGLCFDDAGLIPTVVRDRYGNLLMVAYSSRESLSLALSEGRGVYFSRSRQEIWRKGESSGNVQTLLSCRCDCDRDTIVFTVEQAGPACHRGSYSCFNTGTGRDFDLAALFELIKDRARRPAETGGSGKPSYTRQLLADRDKLRRKIMEEAYEVVSYSSRDNLRWEIADLLYFVSVLAASEGIEWEDIVGELAGRNGC